MIFRQLAGAVERGPTAGDIGNPSPAKMLGQLQALRLVVRADAPAIEGLGPRQHMFVDETTDDLTVLDDEWHLVGAHLEHRAGAAPACARITEPRIEEARIVDAKFANQWIEWNHLGGVIGRHLDGFLGRQDVELVRIKYQATVAPRPDWLPEFRNVVARPAIHIDDASMALGAVADEPVRTETDEINADWNAVREVRSFGIDEALAPVQRGKRLVSQHRIAAAKPELRQPRPFAHQHREGARADLNVKRAMVSGIDAVESTGLVGDHAGEDVEPASRAFRIGGSRKVGRQRQAFHQGHDVDAAGLQHRPVAKRNLVQLQFVDALADGRIRPRQEACPDPIGDLAETQVDARRLNLVLVKRARGNNDAGLDERRNQ